jgi:hypothetical protein
MTLKYFIEVLSAFKSVLIIKKATKSRFNLNKTGVTYNK